MGLFDATRTTWTPLTKVAVNTNLFVWGILMFVSIIGTMFLIYFWISDVGNVGYIFGILLGGFAASMSGWLFAVNWSVHDDFANPQLYNDGGFGFSDVDKEDLQSKTFDNFTTEQIDLYKKKFQWMADTTERTATKNLLGIKTNTDGTYDKSAEGQPEQSVSRAEGQTEGSVSRQSSIDSWAGIEESTTK